MFRGAASLNCLEGGKKSISELQESGRGSGEAGLKRWRDEGRKKPSFHFAFTHQWADRSACLWEQDGSRIISMLGHEQNLQLDPLLLSHTHTPLFVSLLLPSLLLPSPSSCRLYFFTRYALYPHIFTSLCFILPPSSSSTSSSQPALCSRSCWPGSLTGSSRRSPW